VLPEGVTAAIDALVATVQASPYVAVVIRGPRGSGRQAAAHRLKAALGKLGLVPDGEAGDPFDPNVHEALLHEYSTEVSESTCVEVLQPGYKVGERIMRPARVRVAEPEGN
jgi:molecular chaperone GrpE